MANEVPRIQSLYSERVIVIDDFAARLASWRAELMEALILIDEAMRGATEEEAISIRSLMFLAYINGQDDVKEVRHCSAVPVLPC